MSVLDITLCTSWTLRIVRFVHRDRYTGVIYTEKDIQNISIHSYRDAPECIHI